MGWLRKKGKQIAGAIRKVGRKLKKGLGKVARAFGKLGPIGSIALSFILPGVGGAIFNFLKGIPVVGNAIGAIGQGLSTAASWVKEGVGTVFNKVTDAIEYGMNAVSKGIGGQGTVGTNFRNWVSDVTGGFIDPSEATKLEPITVDTATGTELVGYKNQQGTVYSPEEGMKLTSPKTVTEAAPKPSLLEGRGEDQSFREYISESKEYGTYKKIEPVRQFGSAMNEQDAAIANYNETVRARQRDYYADFGQNILGAGSTHRSVGPMNFINMDEMFASNDIAQYYNKAVYGGLLPQDTLINHNVIALGAPNYGANLFNIMGED